jgi:aryl-alcohol dehydrogenase-like predicted oxidoreductase
MKQVLLPNSTRTVGRIGFGCAYLTGGLERRSARRIVDAAFDSGIRHFDVAPPYGLGTAEDVLGEALQGRRDSVTLVTKVGIQRPLLTMRQQALRFVAKPVRRLLPSLSRRHAATVLRATAVRGRFALDEVRDSVAESLRRLRVDRLDGLLLHEVSADDITDELLRYLDERQRAGVVGAVGLATSVERLEAIAPEIRQRFQIIQYSWSVIDRDVAGISSTQFQITHRSIMNAHAALSDWMARDSGVRQRLCDATNADLGDATVLGQILLGAAVAHSPEGIVLVGTRNPKRVVENAALLTDDRLVVAGARLRDALARDARVPTGP